MTPKFQLPPRGVCDSNPAALPLPTPGGGPHPQPTKNHMKKLLCVLALSAALFPAVQAGETSYVARDDSKVTYTPEPPLCFRGGEWNVDLFGVYGFSGSESERVLQDPAWGGGAGVGYFFNQYIGVGLEAFAVDTEPDATGQVALNVTARFPIQDACIAPYLFGGVGIVFNANDPEFDGDRDERDSTDDGLVEAHIGLGVEYRCTQNVGVFTDIRYTFVEKQDTNFGLVRFGVRFAF